MNQICKFVISRKNDAIVTKIVNTRLTKFFMAIFAPDERLPSPATLYDDDKEEGTGPCFLIQNSSYIHIDVNQSSRGQSW